MENETEFYKWRYEDMKKDKNKWKEQYNNLRLFVEDEFGVKIIPVKQRYSKFRMVKDENNK